MILYVVGAGTPVPMKEKFGTAFVLGLNDEN
jgi:hypothetical protein